MFVNRILATTVTACLLASPLATSSASADTGSDVFVLAPCAPHGSIRVHPDSVTARLNNTHSTRCTADYTLTQGKAEATRKRVLPGDFRRITVDKQPVVYVLSVRLPNGTLKVLDRQRVG